MSTCFDVYVLPGVCGDIQTYPSQVHPAGRVSSWGVEVKPLFVNDDEDAITLILMKLML